MRIGVKIFNLPILCSHLSITILPFSFAESSDHLYQKQSERFERKGTMKTVNSEKEAPHGNLSESQNTDFADAVQSEIYVDKTGLL